MPSLYEILQVPSNAPRELIQRNYKLLSYKYKCESQDERLIQLNYAIKILSDPYQRSFYNLFGEYGLPMLSNPVDSYIYPRIATSYNIFLCFLYIASILFNSTGWGFLYRLFDSYLLINILYIVNPSILIVSCLNLTVIFRKHRSYLRGFYYWCFQLFTSSFEILLISLALDALVPFLIAAVSTFCLETIQFALFLILRRETIKEDKRELLFRAIKTSAIMLYFIPTFKQRMYIPFIIVFAFGTLIFFTWFILDFLVLLFLFVLNCYCSNPDNSLFSLCILICYNLVIFSFLFLTMRFYKRIPKPLSFFAGPKAFLSPPRHRELF
ncbi:hypothetical protein PAEPH01_1469 [Pancytospora epiphaga]|nr:hypothetical protein PAEPH01_1469 [Pancytospora epiphaga]